MLLEAEFLAITLVLVYVGAVMVLFLFVVMMLDINLDQLREGFWKWFPFGAFVALLMAGEMAMVLTGKQFGIDEMPAPPSAGGDYSNTKELGRLIYTEYVYAFELAAVILSRCNRGSYCTDSSASYGYQIAKCFRTSCGEAGGPCAYGVHASRKERINICKWSIADIDLKRGR